MSTISAARLYREIEDAPDNVRYHYKGREVVEVRRKSIGDDRYIYILVDDRDKIQKVPSFTQIDIEVTVEAGEEYTPLYAEDRFGDD
jgi:hypothetical protein